MRTMTQSGVARRVATELCKLSPMTGQSHSVEEPQPLEVRVENLLHDGPYGPYICPGDPYGWSDRAAVTMLAECKGGAGDCEFLLSYYSSGSDELLVALNRALAPEFFADWINAAVLGVWCEAKDIKVVPDPDEDGGEDLHPDVDPPLTVEGWRDLAADFDDAAGRGGEAFDGNQCAKAASALWLVAQLREIPEDLRVLHVGVDEVPDASGAWVVRRADGTHPNRRLDRTGEPVATFARREDAERYVKMHELLAVV